MERTYEVTMFYSMSHTVTVRATSPSKAKTAAEEKFERLRPDEGEFANYDSKRRWRVEEK